MSEARRHCCPKLQGYVKVADSTLYIIYVLYSAVRSGDCAVVDQSY